MKINLDDVNPALISIIKNPSQVITLDANFLIPPDRSDILGLVIPFNIFKSKWLNPIFQAFDYLAIHEAVYEELKSPEIKAFIDSKLDTDPPKLTLHRDRNLSEIENVYRNTIEKNISLRTNYEPLLDNREDRGEVKSLAYIAVKELLYFGAHDYTAIQLIEKSEAWKTGLDNIQAIKWYELLFYLNEFRFTKSRRDMKMFYKYQYYSTIHERKTNPSWGDFVKGMRELYNDFIKKHPR